MNYAWNNSRLYQSASKTSANNLAENARQSKRQCTNDLQRKKNQESCFAFNLERTVPILPTTSDAILSGGRVLSRGNV